MEKSLQVDYGHRQSTPISILFDELLSSIFLILVPSWSSAGYYITYKVRAHISQVCSRWRQLSLSIPRLWKSIELSHHKQGWSEELFRRSANAPFIEIFSPSASHFDNMALHIPGILPRIRFLYGSLSTNAWVQLFNSAQQPGAQLEYFRLVDSHATVAFHGHVPPLRYMKMLKTDNMDLTSPFFSNLRVVYISQPTLSVPYLASVAMNMPFLEKLNVKTRVIIDNERTRPILFPHLRHLDYDDQNFLKYVDVPQECVLDTFCQWSEHINGLANIVPRLIHDHKQKGNPCLGVEISSAYLTIHNRQKTSHWDDRGDQIFMDITRQHWQILPQILMPRLANILPTITILNFESHLTWPWEDAGSFLCHFTGVHTLYFGSSDWFSAFVRLKQLYDNGSGPRMLLPSLNTLCFLPDYPLTLQGGEAAELKSYLSWRIEQGSPIKYVEGYLLQDNLEDYSVQVVTKSWFDILS